MRPNDINYRYMGPGRREAMVRYNRQDSFFVDSPFLQTICYIANSSINISISFHCQLMEWVIEMGILVNAEEAGNNAFAVGIDTLEGQSLNHFINLVPVIGSVRLNNAEEASCPNFKQILSAAEIN